MGVRNRESHWMIEQPSRSRQERFAENHGGHRCGSNKSVPVIECLGASGHRSSEKALIVPGRFTVDIEPLRELGKNARNPRRRGFLAFLPSSRSGSISTVKRPGTIRAFSLDRWPDAPRHSITGTDLLEPQ